MATTLLPTPEHIAFLAARLAAGELVAVPTETVYGLAGDARSARAIERIYAAKGRPASNPLIVHYPSLAAAAADVVVDARAEVLAARFWPGPLTLVLPRRPGGLVAERASAGLPTLAVRCPAHPATQALLRACGFPLVAPSANPSGRLSPSTAEHVEQGLGARIGWILDGGPTRHGVESTVVFLGDTGPQVLREGAVTREQLVSVLGPLAAPERFARPPSPGLAFRHYAPRAPVILGTDGPRQAGDALLAFGPGPLPGGFATVEQLSARGDLDEAAARLFAALHRLEAAGAARIFVMAIPEEGVGRAINDRLRRAAAATAAR